MSKKNRHKGKSKESPTLQSAEQPDEPKKGAGVPAWAPAAARVLVGIVRLVAGLQKAAGAPEEFAAVIDP